MSDKLSKIIGAIVGAIIIALQTVNIGETNNAENQVMESEKGILKQIYELEKTMAGLTNDQVARSKETLEMLKQLLEQSKASPTPTPKLSQ